MPGSPLTGQGGQFGGPRYGWGDVPNQPGAGVRSGSAGSQTNFNSGLNRGRFTNSPEAGLHRGEWQWRGHGPDAQRSYGWDYQGGVGRDEITQRTEARMGPSFQARMAQERSGGLPQGRYAVDYDRLGERAGRGGQDVNYDGGWQGRTGGMQGGGMDRYGSDFGGGYASGGHTLGAGMDRGYDHDMGGYGASGGHTFGGGNRADAGGGWSSYGHTLGSGGRTGRGGYGRDFRGSYGAERGGFGGGMQGGGYGGRGYDRGMRGSPARGGYGGDYARPLSDAEFYQRVERW